MNVSNLAVSPTYSDADELAQRLEERIRAIGEQLAVTGSDWPRAHELICTLERLIMEAEATDPEIARFLLPRFAQHELDTFNTHYCKWETELEWRFVNQLLRKECGWESYHLYQRFEDLIAREIGLLGGRRPERMLFIGSGPFPISALHIGRRLGSHIVCIDHDESAVDISREIIRRLDLAGLIEIVHAAGSEYDATSFDAVFVALLAKPKKALLKNIRKARGGNFLCRTSRGLRKFVYEATRDDALENFQVAGAQLATGDQTISTLLLKRA